jgi:peroxiredoxin
MKTYNQKYSNKKYGFEGVGVVVAVVIGIGILGYFLYKTPAKNSNLSQNQTSTSQNNGDLNSLIGKPLPEIQLVDKDGKTYTNADFKGKNTVLFFSEGLMCYPACWNQIAEFGSDSRFATADTQAFSVLMDPSSNWQQAVAKMPQLAKANTLFDVNGTVSRQFNLLSLPSSMHKGILPGHTYILIDKEGIVRYVKDDPNMAIADDQLLNQIAGFK